MCVKVTRLSPTRPYPRRTFQPNFGAPLPVSVMTTAHRATWKPAQGGAAESGSFALHAPSAATAARDAPAHRVLKTREAGAVPASAARLRDELTDREQAHKRARRVAEGVGELLGEAVKKGRAEGVAELGEGAPAFRELDKDVELDDGDSEDEGLAGGGGARGVADSRGGGDGGDSDGYGDPAVAGNEGVGRSSGDGSDDSEDDSDDEAELRAELARIRAERAAEKAAEQEATAGGNPLLPDLADHLKDGTDDESVSAPASSAASFGIKRRWNDDVVFKNQSRREPKPEVRFVNDTTRNDFHRRFLKRFVR